PEEDGYKPAATQYERTIYMVITEKTIPYVAEKLDRLGYVGKGFGPLDPSSAQHQSFARNQIEVTCRHETNQNGEMRETWDLTRGASELHLDPLSSKDVRDLDALFGKSLKGSAAKSAAPKPSPEPKSQVVAPDGT